MADIFALDKGGNNKRLLSSHDKDATYVKIGGKSARMVQDASIQYQQRTEARFEIGYESLYWVAGQSQGTLTLNKLVAKKAAGAVWKGLKKGMKDSGQNGNAATSIQLQTSNGGATGDGICQSASISANVGNMAVQDNSTWVLGDLAHS